MSPTEVVLPAISAPVFLRLTTSLDVQYPVAMKKTVDPIGRVIAIFGDGTIELQARCRF